MATGPYLCQLLWKIQDWGRCWSNASRLTGAETSSGMLNNKVLLLQWHVKGAHKYFLWDKWIPMLADSTLASIFSARWYMSILEISPNHLVVEAIHWWPNDNPAWILVMSHDQTNRLTWMRENLEATGTSGLPNSSTIKLLMCLWYMGSKEFFKLTWWRTDPFT